jgi:hypothetical protein
MERSVMKHPTQAELNAGLTKINEESAGIVDFFFIDPETCGALVSEAEEGVWEAVRLMRCTVQLLDAVENATADDPMLCSCCPAALKISDLVVCIALPSNDAATMGAGMGFCRACVRRLGSARAVTVVAARLMWPKSRLIEPMNVSGRA